MTGASPIPNAATIAIADALKLLDEEFKELAVGVAKGEYALGSGQHFRERVPVCESSRAACSTICRTAQERRRATARLR
jgi:hypothetical protein